MIICFLKMNHLYHLFLFLQADRAVADSRAASSSSSKSSAATAAVSRAASSSVSAVPGMGMSVGGFGSAPPLTHYRAEMVWDAMQQEVQDMLSEYIQVCSTEIIVDYHEVNLL